MPSHAVKKNTSMLTEIEDKVLAHYNVLAGNGAQETEEAPAENEVELAEV